MRSFALVAALSALVGSSAVAAVPDGDDRSQSAHAAMAMGFDQDRTAHHFYLYEDGGAIDVAVKDADDTKNRDAIRSHLPHIAMMFGQGNFETPMVVHDTKNVPGAAALTKWKDAIKYTYAETPRGGRVDIVTTSREALAAVHEFLTFQIRDHKTGDPVAVRKR
jgi:hypothetical protein